MKELTTKVYKCDHCNKISLGKGGMTRHESVCKKNPKNICYCWDCKYRKEEEITIGKYPNQFLYNLSRCEKFDKILIPISLVRHAKSYSTSKRTMVHLEMLGETMVMPSELEKCREFKIL